MKCRPNVLFIYPHTDTLIGVPILHGSTLMFNNYLEKNRKWQSICYVGADMKYIGPVFDFQGWEAKFKNTTMNLTMSIDQK